MFSFIRTQAKDRERVPNYSPPAGRLAPLIRRGAADARQRAEAPHRLSGRPVSFEDFRLEVERSRRYGHSLFLARFACGRADEGRFERSDKVACAVRTLVRTVDRVWAEGRNVYVLLPECDREMGEAALERMRRALAGISTDDQTIETGWAVFPDDGLTAGAVLDALRGDRATTTDAPPSSPSMGPTAVPNGGPQTRPSEMNPRVA
jgi:hypothetical protein